MGLPDLHGKIGKYSLDVNRRFQPNCVCRRKHGGRPAAAANMTSFMEMIQQCELHDLGFEGPRYTWSNMRQDANLVQERLDRA